MTHAARRMAAWRDNLKPPYRGPKSSAPGRRDGPVPGRRRPGVRSGRLTLDGGRHRVTMRAVQVHFQQCCVTWQGNARLAIGPAPQRTWCVLRGPPAVGQGRGVNRDVPKPIDTH